MDSRSLKKEKEERSAIIIIWGATGDLSRKKLIPALLNLFIKGFLPKNFHIIGVSRRDYSDDDFQVFLKTESISKKQHEHSPQQVENFLSQVSYSQGLFEEKETYKRLEEKVTKLEKESESCSDKLFYLAVHPSSYEVIFKNLGGSKMVINCGEKEGWARVLVEKPFGNDVKTAQKLDKLLGTLFREEQIFRIDHYLAKEALQNILIFRFSNAMFEPIWNRHHVEKVEIRLLEQSTIEGRGEFYDKIGSLQDVGQNHILQMLALVSMEKPQGLSASKIRKERLKILSNLLPLSLKNLDEQVVKGQYRGYLEEKGVSSESKTETYFKIKAFIKNSRWKGVPFYLESGKGLKKSQVCIKIYFRKPKVKKIEENIDCYSNVLTFRIQPDEGIDLDFWTKVPGFKNKTEKKTLSFSYEQSENNIPDAYEKVLYDCIRGDQTLFASTDEIQESWRFISSISKHWDEIALHKYEKDTNPDF